MNTLSYEELKGVGEIVSALVPGYFIQELNPFEALETGQGNCFTNAMIAAAAISHTFDTEVSVAWSKRLHGTDKPSSVFKIPSEQRASRNTVSRNIGHIELLVPRGVDEFDVLALGFGLNVKPGSTFHKEESQGSIISYNFDNLDPADTDISKRRKIDEPLVYVNEDGVVVPTEEGDSIGIVAGDWQMLGTDYLAALNLPEINYDELIHKTACFMSALLSSRE